MRRARERCGLTCSEQLAASTSAGLRLVTREQEQLTSSWRRAVSGSPRCMPTCGRNANVELARLCGRTHQRHAEPTVPEVQVVR